MDVTVWSTKTYVSYARAVSDATGWTMVTDVPVGHCDLAYIVGMDDPSSFPHTLEATKAADGRAVHWVGPDLERVTGPEALPAAVHLAPASAVPRLRSLGIQVEEARLPIGLEVEAAPLPRTPTVVCPLMERETLGARMVRLLQTSLPEVRFECFGPDTYDDEALHTLLGETTVAVQLDGHHGERYTRLALAAGRAAVVPYDLPYAIAVEPSLFLDVHLAVERGLCAQRPDADAATYWTRENSTGRFREVMSMIGYLGEGEE